MMFKRTYYYHVAFHLKNKGGEGFGSITISTKAKIENESNLKNVANHIGGVLNGGSVVILNWKRIKGRKQL